MAKILTLDVTSFKFADNETDLNFRTLQNGVIISDSTLSATIKIKQADIGYLKSVSAKWVDKHIVISSGDLSDLPVGSYLLELWLGSSSGYEIYPDSGFVRLYINKNATGISGNLISSITLGEFQQQFSDLAKEVNNKIDDFTKLIPTLENMQQVMRGELNDLHAQTDSNTRNIELKANLADMTSLQNAITNLQNEVEAFGITPENSVTIKSLLDEITGILSDLSQKGIDIADLKTKMNAIYNNALADHAEVANARGMYNTLPNRLQAIDGNISQTTSELTDIRVAFDGKQYSTAGNAVREQLKQKVDLSPGVNLLDSSIAEKGFYISYASGNKSPNADYQINYIQVSAGTMYYLNFANNVHIAFFDSSKKYISGLINPTNFVAPSNAKEMSVSYSKTQADVITVSLKAVKEPVSANKGIDGQTILYASVGLRQLDNEVRNSLVSDKKIITVGPTGKYQSLVRAIKDNMNTINTYKLVNYTNNIYDDYIDFYGTDYFNKYNGYLTTTDVLDRGINLKNGESLIGDAKSVIRFDYDKSNPKVNEFFSPLNLTINNTVDNVRFKIGDGTCRYIIHDDFAFGNNGINIISNCIFEGKSFLNTAIGGGMSTNSTYIIDTCIFRGAGALAVTYHNNSQDNALNRYVVKKCFCSQGSSIRGSWYGPSTGLTPMIVTGCTADTITCVSAGNVQNIELIEYNNIIRNA